MTLSWAVGAGGLLGSAVLRVSEGSGVEPWRADRIRWGMPGANGDLRAQLARFVADAGDAAWQILWCAGAGVTDSDPAGLDREVDVLETFLGDVAALTPAQRASGTLVYASSAGAVYGGSERAPFTERTVPVPLGHYGIAKLRAEDACRHLALDGGVRVVVARIANLYGPGQSPAKQQGLVSRLCRSALTRTPLSVFVALDTLRDYIYVDDCARMLLAAAEEARRSVEPFHVKIFATGRAVSVAAVLGQFKSVRIQRPLVVMGASAASRLQGRDLRLSSEVWTHLDSLAVTTFPEGVARTLEDMRRSLARSGA
jgi:UDP-glucose 4-epimerase